MTSVGMLMRDRSLRKSVCHAGTQATLAVAEAPAATFQQDWTTCSLTRLPRRRSVLKKFLKNSVKNAYRSAAAALAIPANTLASTPSGLSGVFSRNGGTEEMNTALLTRSDP